MAFHLSCAFFSPVNWGTGGAVGGWSAVGDVFMRCCVVFFWCYRALVFLH